MDNQERARDYARLGNIAERYGGVDALVFHQSCLNAALAYDPCNPVYELRLKKISESIEMQNHFLGMAKAEFKRLGEVA